MGACTGPCCAYTCLLLSSFSVVFLAVLGCLLATHSETVEIKPANMHSGMVASFTAAGIYAICVIASVIYLCRHARTAGGGGRSGGGLPPEVMSSRQRHYRRTNTSSNSTAFLQADEEMGQVGGGGGGGSVQLSSLSKPQEDEKHAESLL
eukprot:GHVS01093291.1.p1 GENE.GHVS01093291.1~~GHVS01093291.1.p1  ORF type:complete len:150 (+),score=23.09 GHVS01093291.1:143-592(+)